MKAKEAKPPAKASVVPARPPELECLAQEKAKVMETLPSTSELAALASNLGRGRLFDDGGARELARQALILWEASRAHLGTQIARRADHAVKVRKEVEALELIARPASFPATLDDFERLVVGGKTVTERRATYREFLRYALRLNKQIENRDAVNVVIPETSIDEVNDAIQRETQEGIPECWYFQHAELFRKWKAQRARKRASNKASKAARAMHAEKAKAKAAQSRKK